MTQVTITQADIDLACKSNFRDSQKHCVLAEAACRQFGLHEGQVYCGTSWIQICGINYSIDDFGRDQIIHYVYMEDDQIKPGVVTLTPTNIPIPKIDGLTQPANENQNHS